ILGTTKKNINDFLIGLTNYIPEVTTTVLDAIQSSVSAIVTIVLIPIMTFFITKDKDKILKACYNYIPKKHRDDATYLYKELNFSMAEFIRSRLLMAVFVGVSTWLMLELFGIPFALIIGILTMICDIIPYIGPFIATSPALIFAFIKSPMTFFWVGFLSIVLQWIEQ
ncbi:AI-2E family transporter, partial [Rhodovulum adriaticum]|uniref:AI-2E family transporter n=1 Tax=Rhodovulum adriaticum TaxID=35804 RepID=UPI0019060C48